MCFLLITKKRRRHHDEDSSAVSLWFVHHQLDKAISFDPYWSWEDERALWSSRLWSLSRVQRHWSCQLVNWQQPAIFTWLVIFLEVHWQ
jgi:hypothetical protein